MTSPTHNAVEALERHFGFRAFLDGQEAVVSALLSGRDALVVMPTGGGKSLCYQLPALCCEGVTVVVSPLIALMKDQVDALQRRGIAAAMINSTLTLAEQKERLGQLRRGELKLVYIAPERFRSGLFLDALREVEIALFAIDEAHCLSQWGHDFRPDYLRLGHALEKLGHPQTAAFTATATSEVRADILQHLRLRDPFECVRGFARPNLSLAITRTATHAEKYARLFKIVGEHRTGIVYCATRKRVEEVYQALREETASVMFYHGGLDDDAREKAQNLFMSKKADVVVATNAFGMGIDRADVRFVVHFEFPGSVEAYYQEAGRAGRDGEPAWCELFFNFADRRTQEFFILGANPGALTIRAVYQALLSWQDGSHEVRVPIKDIAERLQIKNEMAVSSALGILARAGYIERFDVPGQRLRGTRLLRPELAARYLELDEAALAEKARRDFAKLDAMIALCDAATCRQRWILDYFGEKDAAECGICDACTRTGTSSQLRASTDDELILLRKALSGVARMSQRTSEGWRGRFGRTKIIAMLIASRSQDILELRLDQLSTYGLLKHVGSGYLNALFREIQAAGLVESTGGTRPVLALTPKGERVMLGRESCSLRWPGGLSVTAISPPEEVRASMTPRRAVSPRPRAGSAAGSRGQQIQIGAAAASSSVPDSVQPHGTAALPVEIQRHLHSVQSPEEGGAPSERFSNSDPLNELGFDAQLFEKLKACRLEIARAAGMPAYVVFHNSTLEFFARLKPKTVEAAKRIRGVSDTKAEKYLGPFLEVIRAESD
ncbi:MAG: RecQ family ATP-dependent DNA helicase [Verrucomicrobiales bacterium]